jgi:hypothetical protein
MILQHSNSRTEEIVYSSAQVVAAHDTQYETATPLPKKNRKKYKVSSFHLTMAETKARRP